VISHLGRHPTAGVLVPGAGGIRKLRWGLEGRGKRGGTRVIYLYASAAVLLFALTAFAKNERADPSKDDRNAFRRLTKVLVETYREADAMSKVAGSIRRGLEQAVEFARGRVSTRTYPAHVPARIDVKKIRTALG